MTEMIFTLLKGSGELFGASVLDFWANKKVV